MSSLPHPSLFLLSFLSHPPPPPSAQTKYSIRSLTSPLWHCALASVSSCSFGEILQDKLWNRKPGSNPAYAIDKKAGLWHWEATQPPFCGLYHSLHPLCSETSLKDVYVATCTLTSCTLTTCTLTHSGGLYHSELNYSTKEALQPCTSLCCSVSDLSALLKLSEQPMSQSSVDLAT